MRLTTVILIAAIMQVSAAGFAQKITLSAKSSSLQSIFTEIRKQSNYDFLCTEDLLKLAKKVDIQVNQAELKDVLEQVFKNQPLTYTIEDRTIVVKEKEKSLFNKLADKLTDLATKLDKPSLVLGRVTNDKNEPLSGATVILKRTKQGTNTDVTGNYVITTAEATDTLLFSFIGYKTLTVPINKRLTINVELEEATSGLDEVVVQAYGQTTQRLTTGNIGRITAAEIEKQPVKDPLLALEGRVAGVEITPQSGYDGGPVKVVIRGKSSINPNFTSDPLYIIDGVPQTILDLRSPTDPGRTNRDYSVGLGSTDLSPAGGSSPLSAYNPSDIASVEILKDADATAIYGSRGANGVILITTKKGAPSKGDFSINLSQGVRFTEGEWPMLNTQQYLAMRREAFKNDSITPTVANAPDLFLLDQNRYTDWQKYIYGNTGTWTNLQAGLSGGNSQVTYRISGNYNETKDITTLKGRDPRGSFSSSLVTHSANQRFTLSLTTNYSFSVTNQVILTGSTIIPPNAPAVYNAQGGLNFADYDKANLLYPFDGLLDTYEGKNSTLNSGLNLSYTIIKGLVAKANIGYNNVQEQRTAYIPIAGQDPVPKEGVAPSGQATIENAHANNVIVEPQVEYNRVISKGSLNVLVGGTYQINNTNFLQTHGSGYTDDDLLHTITAAPILHASDGSGQYKYAGIFGRINYNWENKYIINLNARRDGSSRFGADNRFGNFGSVGTAYIVSEEKWIKAMLPKALSTVKVRGSYGTTGSDAVGDYQYLTQWASGATAGTDASAIPTYNGVNPLASILHTNPDFHWQVNKKLEGALDLGFMEDRINMEVAYYRDRTNNQLVSFPTPAFTGFTSVTANSPANVQNDGWEFSVSAQVINGKHFHWNSSFNMGINRNKLISYPNFDLSPYYTTMKIGGSLGDSYVYQYTGVDPKTGQYTYLDANHDGKIQSLVTNGPPGTGTSDAVAVINLTPKYSGGMGQQFSFNNLSLSLFFTFRKGVAANALNGSNFGSLNNVSLYEYDNRWQKPGDIALAPRLTTVPQASDGNFTSSTGAYTDASFIRLSNAAFSYTMPSKLLRKIGLKSLLINATAQNIFVLTKYKGLDPEITSFGSMPPVRTITWGLSASL